MVVHKSCKKLLHKTATRLREWTQEGYLNSGQYDGPLLIVGSFKYYNGGILTPIRARVTIHQLYLISQMHGCSLNMTILRDIHTEQNYLDIFF